VGKGVWFFWMVCDFRVIVGCGKVGRRGRGEGGWKMGRGSRFLIRWGGMGGSCRCDV